MCVRERERERGGGVQEDHIPIITRVSIDLKAWWQLRVSGTEKGGREREGEREGEGESGRKREHGI